MAIKLVEQGVTIGVTPIPYRVNKALYIMRGNNVTPIAFFKNERYAKEFERILDSIATPIQIAKFQELEKKKSLLAFKRRLRRDILNRRRGI